MRIYVIRHGETAANQEGRLQGLWDMPLNENGIRLASVTGEALRDVRFDACFSSPLTRARRTAELVLSHSGNTGVEVRTDARLREIDMGEWEGKRFREEFHEVDPGMLKQFFDDPFALGATPGGEKVREVCRRTREFLEELADGALKREDEILPQTVLVATHGFALRAMMNFLYEDPSDFWHGHVPLNCAVDIIEAENGQMRLIGEKIYYSRDDGIDYYK